MQGDHLQISAATSSSLGKAAARPGQTLLGAFCDCERFLRGGLDVKGGTHWRHWGALLKVLGVAVGLGRQRLVAASIGGWGCPCPWAGCGEAAPCARPQPWRHMRLGGWATGGLRREWKAFCACAGKADSEVCRRCYDFVIKAGAAPARAVDAHQGRAAGSGPGYTCPAVHAGAGVGF